MAVFKRRIVRERVLQILYALELNEDNTQMIIDSLMADVQEKADRDFGTDLVRKVVKHKKELDDQIGQHVNNWEMNRIALIDKLLLRMGICEILFFPEIPPKVSINESIEVAKEFSTAGSGKFINGILDAILAEIRSKGELNKLGRGLVDETIVKPKKK